MTAPAAALRPDPLLAHPRSLALLLVLTFSTGVADAVGYLGLDRVFTGNMTGNVVILGMGAAGADDLPVVGPVCALAAFMAGAAVGGRCVRGHDAGWGRRVSLLMLAVAALLAVTATYAAVEPRVGSEDTGGNAPTVAVAAVVAVAMGLQAALARHVAVKDVTTVVVTSTITGLAADSWLGARTGQPWVRRLLAILLIAAGAAVGALLLRIDLAAGLALSAALTVVVAGLAAYWSRPTG